YSRRNARRPGRIVLQPPTTAQAARPLAPTAPGRRGTRSISRLARCRRKRLRVLVDHLLDVLLQPHQHLLTNGDVEIDLDRLVRRLDRDATGQGHGGRQGGELEHGSGHFFPPGGVAWGGGVLSVVGLALPCCSTLVVLSTSTLSAGESTGNGITGAIACVGSLKALPI